MEQDSDGRSETPSPSININLCVCLYLYKQLIFYFLIVNNPKLGLCNVLWRDILEYSVFHNFQKRVRISSKYFRGALRCACLFGGLVFCGIYIGRFEVFDSCKVSIFLLNRRRFRLV